MNIAEIITIVLFVTGGLVSAVWAISSKLGTTIINQLTKDMAEMKGDIKEILKTLEENGKMGVRHESRIEEHEKQIQLLFRKHEELEHKISLIEKAHYKNHSHEKE